MNPRDLGLECFPKKTGLKDSEAVSDSPTAVNLGLLILKPWIKGAVLAENGAI
jgi:hypothetical protein